MKCPFCGEEIQDGAKKCKHCKERLKFKVCPVCKESVPESSEVCPCCEEPFIKDHDWVENNNEIHVETVQETPKIDKDKKNIENAKTVHEVEHKGLNKWWLKKIIDDYWTTLLIIIIIIWIILYQKISNRNSWWQNESEYIPAQEVVQENSKPEQIYKIDSQSSYLSSFDGWFNSYDQLKFVENTTDGYYLQNSYYSCFIPITNINDFKDVVDKWLTIDKATCVPRTTTNVNYDNYKKIWVVIDNTYAQDELENLDTTWPDKRVNTLQKRLRNHNGENIELTLWFLYTTRSNSGLSEKIHGDLTHLRTDPSIWQMSIKVVKWKDYIFNYIKSQHKLWFKDVAFVIDYSNIDCTPSSYAWFDFDCYDIDTLYQKISKIYQTTYKNWVHSWNAMIEYFSTSDKKAFIKDNDIVYIFTDWQFELTDNQMSLKNEGRKMINYNDDFPLSNFSVNSYSKYKDYFTKFWSVNVPRKNLWKIDCSWTSIYIIWLIQDDSGFKDFAKDYFKNVMFTWCNVDFKELN